VHCCTSHLCSQEGVRAALTRTRRSSHAPTLRADPPSEQQVHSKVSLRRAVDAVSRCGVACVRSGAQGQAACEPGGGECGGVPVHPPRLRSHRTSSAQALLTILMRHAATLTCSRSATVVGMVSDVH
jgi:hypothetical protein